MAGYSKDGNLRKFYAGVGLALIAAAILFAVLSFLRENWAANQTPGGFERWVARWLLFRNRDDGSGRVNPLPPTAENLAAGRELFEKHCAFCHGMDGHGPAIPGIQFYPPVPSLAQPEEPLTDAQLYSTIELGIRYTAMPSFGQALSDEQIWKVTSFVRSLPRLVSPPVSPHEPATAIKPPAP